MPKPLFEQARAAQPAQSTIDLMKTAVQQNVAVQQSVGQVALQQSIGRGNRSTSTAIANLDLSNPVSISNYGAKAQENVAKFADEVLEYVKTSSTGQVGDKLVSIVSIAKELNVSDLNGTSSKIPLIGGLIDSFNKKRDKFVSKFNSLKDQIDKVIGELDNTNTALEKRIKLLDQLYDHNMAEYQELEALITDGKEFLTLQQQTFEEQRNAAVLTGKINDPIVAQSYTDWQARIGRFSKRISDLEACQMMAVHAMPEIRMIQSNNQMLIEKFNNAKTLTIPAWKKQFVLAVSLDEQKKAAHLAQTIDDATNDFYKANADMLGENAISVARSNQRSIIDLESLQHMQTTLISTFEEMKKIEAEGEAQRKQMSASIGNMKKELYQKLVVQSK